MMTAPSTIRPKSIAPRLIRLALMPALQHPRRGQQHRERDDQRGDQRGAEVAEQQEQHHDDQQRALGEVLRHRARSSRRPARCGPARCGAGRRAAACGRSPHLGVDRRGDGAAVARRSASARCRPRPPRPFALALPVRSSRPIATSATSRTRTGTPSRVATTTLRISSMRLDPAAGAHHVALAVALDVAGAAAGVVALQRLGHVARRTGRGRSAAPDRAGRGTASRSRRSRRRRRRPARCGAAAG